MTPSPSTPLAERLRHILPYYRHNRWAFFVGFLWLAATSATAAALPYLMKLATEALSAPSGAYAMEVYALALVGVALLNAFFRVRSRTHIFGIGRQVEYALRQTYHAKLLSLDIPPFHAAPHDTYKTGDLVSRGSNDVLAVRMFIGPGFLQVSNTLMLYAVTLPIMISLDPYLTLLTLAPFPFILGITRLLTKRLYRLSKIVADRFGQFSAFVQEAIAGVAVIRAHAREHDWNRRFSEEADDVYLTHKHHAMLQGVFAPMVVLAGGVGGWIILRVGGQEVIAGHLTIGDFVAFSGYLAVLVWPTVGFGWILTVLQRGLAALDRIGEVLDRQPFALMPLLDPLPSPASSSGTQGALSIRGLHFPQDAPFLKGIAMEIAAGCFVGLVGRVGSGKTTLFNCLARLYPVSPGTIFLDGTDIMALPEKTLRHTVAMAQQESFLFSTTIRANLCLGRPDVDDKTAWEAVRMAAFDEEIRAFPDGMETVVGERGITLSGGQRQRLALARALLMEPNILLLDDIFSSVDARTEATILANMQQLAGRCTILMVCHRTTSLKHANPIYLFDHGAVVASGCHATLLEQAPLYRELHRQMTRAEALESLQ